MKKLFIFLLLGVFFVSLAGAIPTYKQGQTIQLTEVCDNCTFVNLTKVTYPNGSFALLGQFSMTKNGTNYNYTFSDTQTLGTYKYVTCGDLDGVLTCEDTIDRTFEVTPSGNSPISQGEAIISLGSILIIILLGSLSLVGSLKAENLVPKAFFFFFGIILFFTAVIYNVSIVSEVLSNSTLISGFETFYYVIATFMGIAVFGLIIFSFIVMIRAWKIKRGLIDR